MPAFKEAITPKNRAVVLASFTKHKAKEGLVDTWTLLTDLINEGRLEEAELFIGDADEVTADTWKVALQQLMRAENAPRAWPLYAAVLDHRPAIEESSYVVFSGFEESAREWKQRAILELVDVYGVGLVFKDWNGSTKRSLLHVCEAWMDVAILELCKRGADPEARDEDGSRPIDTMDHFGQIAPVTLEALAPTGVSLRTLERFLAGSDGRTIAEVLAVLTAAVEVGIAGDGTPIQSLGTMRRSREERLQLLGYLEKHNLCGGTRKDALVAAAHSGTSAALEHLIELTGAKPGDVYYYGCKGQMLLHICCDTLGACNDEADKVEALELLRAWGENADTPNKRKRTPIDLYKKSRGSLAPGTRRRVERALGMAREGGPTLGDVFENPTVAYAVASALLRGKLIKPSVLTKLAKAARKDVDDDDIDTIERAALEAVKDLPLGGLDLESVTRLSWDWSEPFFAWFDEIVGTENGGESDVLRVTSLDGLAALTRLASLDLGTTTYAAGVCDLAPLANHPSLQEIVLPVKVDDVAPLLSIANLRKGDRPVKRTRMNSLTAIADLDEARTSLDAQ